MKSRTEEARANLGPLCTQAQKLRKEIANLAGAIADLGKSKSLTAQLAEREAKLELIEATK
jgi:hypothetical protein